ncbi:fungal-specific transcription factor domain protein [Rhizoctonia solani 123E]|uniref:Fungal-specific transcription factor domain protein n=1 Tax=Rhizoctonia solani 123E TaxID=1423351 RepID=A0A074SF88_9AGAM|nr:fungal-specific transcription factor domain protein [Rhizoctonia solani 123E]
MDITCSGPEGLSNGDSMLTCAPECRVAGPATARQRKCDGAQPICRRCARDKVECGGYSNSKNPIRGLSDPRKPRPVPIPSICVIEPSVPIRNYHGLPGTPSNTGQFPLSPESYISPTRNIPLIGSPTPSVSPSYLRQAPSPPYHPNDTGPFDEISRVFSPPKKNVRKSMTPGQASLFDALWSLGRPEDDSFVLGSYSTFLDRNPLGPLPAGPSYDVPQAPETIDPEDSHDAQEVAARLWRPLPLDKRVRSNTLPFVLQSYSLWMRQFLFEPIRIIPVARDYILDEYYEGPEARWRMMTTSNAVRAITGSTGYTLKDLEVLQFHMHQDFPKAASSFGTDRGADMIKALLAMSTTYEFIAISLKVFPLAMVVKTMQAVAPLFRRACPDPDDRQVNLPNLLSNINIGLEYYATLDIVLGAIIHRPMNFRYDTTFPPGVHESIFNIENGPGLRWTNGIPDRLVITLARMNALLEDFGSAVDREVIQELELEIEGFKTFAVASADPDLAAARLVVQESWRQAAYIYLYMGLCGADSNDARVINAHTTFMELWTRTKPGRIPDSFLVLPLPILGIAARHPDDQEILKSRMLAMPECTRKNTPGNQFIRMLEFIWGLGHERGQSATWSDLRLASLYVADV